MSQEGSAVQPHLKSSGFAWHRVFWHSSGRLAKVFEQASATVELNCKLVQIQEVHLLPLKEWRADVADGGQCPAQPSVKMP